MTTHDAYQPLLAIREDLSATESAELEAHLRDCAPCRDAAAAYLEQDQVVRKLPRASLSPAIQQAIVRRAVESGANVGRADARGEQVQAPRSHGGWWRDAIARRFGRRMSGVSGAIAAVAIVVAVVLHPGQSSVSPANAYDLLRAAAQASARQFPYTGSSEVSYLALPEYTLPDSVATVTGRHRALIRWEVRDATHFRVDIQTVLPALDAGHETVVRQGQKIFRYDSRTNTAAVGTASPSERKFFDSALLPGLRAGGERSEVLTPDPAQSIQKFLAQQESAQAKVHGYARIIGHTVLLGRRVDIVQFAPLVRVYQETAGHKGPGVLVHVAGVGKAWIDHDHPFLLQYREYGIGGLHDVGTEGLNFVYRVTSIHYGAAPRSSQLVFHPPVPIRNAGHWTIGSSVYTGLYYNRQFIYAPVPDRYAHLDWVQPPGVGGSEAIGPLPVVTKASMLYSVSGGHRTTYLYKGDPFGTTYITGPYLYVEERIQVHGLPIGLKTGMPLTTGACRMWIDKTNGGVHWVAFQHRHTSVLVVSNALSTHDLLQYAYRELCSPRW